MKQEIDTKKALVFSYLAHRKTIGLVGVSLPFIMALGGWVFFQSGIQSSISSYYHTGMRNIFVGTLWTIGILLLSYNGYDHADAIACKLGCLLAIGISIFPTPPDFNPSTSAQWVGYIHLTLATMFFTTLVYFSLYLFTKSDQSKLPIRKLQRNRVYKICGYTIIICILFATACYFLLDEASLINDCHPIFWLETIAAVAFGFSWLTKGQAILQDEVESITSRVLNEVGS